MFDFPYRLPSGDIIEHKNRSLITSFCGKRTVLCTSPPNGGIRHNLRYVFNNDAKSPVDNFCQMYAPDMAGHMTELMRKIGLDPTISAGLTTAADMENAAVCEKSYDNFTVTAVVTAGIDKNGGRVGDRADWHESNGTTCPVKQPPFGTVNIMLFINANLTEEAMLQALTTCTEAKCAAIQELLAPSVYSNGIATGSGTDGTLIVANTESKVRLTNASKHYKLGEVIGQAVMCALKEALFRQTDLSPAWQHNALRRMSRFGIKAEDFGDYPEEVIKSTAEDSLFLTQTSLFVHLLDELNWGLLSFAEVCPIAEQIAASFGVKDFGSLQEYDDLIRLWCCLFTDRLKKSEIIYLNL